MIPSLRSPYRAVLAGAVAVGGLVLAPQAASAATTCTYNAANHTINVTLDTSIVSAQLMLYRNGAAIQRWTQNHGIAGGTLHASWIENQQASTGNFYEIFVNPSANVNVRGGITATTWQVTAIP